MLEQSQQPVQGQTSQPNPQTQVPQSPQETNLQSSVDQRALEATNNVIQVPGSTTGNSQPDQTTAQLATDDSSLLSDVQIGTTLLVGSFLLAITLVLLLARLAYRHQKNTATAIEEVEPLPLSEEQPTPVAPKKNKSAKKQTRRQRRKQK